MNRNVGTLNPKANLREILRTQQNELKQFDDTIKNGQNQNLKKLGGGAIIIGVAIILIAIIITCLFTVPSLKPSTHDWLNTCTNFAGTCNNCSKGADNCTSSSNKLSGD